MRKLAENSDLTHKTMPYSIEPTDSQYVIVNDETGERLYTHETYEDALEQVQALYANEEMEKMTEKIRMMSAGDLVSYNSDEMYGFVKEVMTSGEHGGLLATESDPVLKIIKADYDEDIMSFVEKAEPESDMGYAYHYASTVSPYKLELPEDAPVFDWEMEGQTDPALPATVAEEDPKWTNPKETPRVRTTLKRKRMRTKGCTTTSTCLN